MNDEQRIKEDSQRIREFEADPEAFTARYYRRHAVDSYPVMTNIARCRENIDYRQDAKERRWLALEEAEANLAMVSESLIKELSLIRPSKGRVPWPPFIEDFSRFREKVARRERERSVEVAHLLAIEEANHKIEEAERDRLIEIEIDADRKLADEDYQKALSTMTSLERQHEKEGAAALKAALTEGRVSGLDVITHLRSVKTGEKS